MCAGLGQVHAYDPKMTCTLYDAEGRDVPPAMTFRPHHKCCTSFQVPGNDAWAFDYIYWPGDHLQIYLRNRHHNPVGFPKADKTIKADQSVGLIKGQVSFDAFLPGQTLSCEEIR
jgi:hypothetical protein